MTEIEEFEIRALALKSGLIDPELSADGEMVTDIGDAKESILEFVALIMEMQAHLTTR